MNIKTLSPSNSIFRRAIRGSIILAVLATALALWTPEHAHALTDREAPAERAAPHEARPTLPPCTDADLIELNLYASCKFAPTGPQLEFALSIIDANLACVPSFDPSLIGPLPIASIVVFSDYRACFNVRNVGNETAYDITVSYAGASVALGTLAPGAETMSSNVLPGATNPGSGLAVATAEYVDSLAVPQSPLLDNAIVYFLAGCTDATAIPSGTPFSSATYFGGYPAANAFDDVAWSLWISSVWDDPAWLGIDLGAATEVTAYEVRFNNPNLTTRAPQDWTLQGSNDGTTWVTLDTQNGQTGWANTEVRSFDLATPAPYQQFRLHITEDNDNRAPIVVISLDELKFHEDCLFG